jgi:hypothetical protein
MGAEHFCRLDGIRQPAEGGGRVARLAGEHLELCQWELAAGAVRTVALDRYAECFIVPLAGTVSLLRAADGATSGGDAGAGGAAAKLERGTLAYVRDTRGLTGVRGAGCRYLLAGWPREGPAGSAGSADGGEPVGVERGGAWQVYRFDEALAPEAPGWRFFSVDGAFLTVGCSYREAPPPAREQPHSHDGEQINVPLEGRFAFTVGGHTETIAPGWAAITPRGVTHTGLHVEFPYFQLIFATPPRGRGYAEFLRSIYRAALP